MYYCRKGVAGQPCVDVKCSFKYFIRRCVLVLACHWLRHPSICCCILYVIMWIATWSELKVSRGTSSSDDAASYPFEFLTVPVAFELVIFIILFPYCHVSPWEWSALRIFQVLHKRAKEHSQQSIFTQKTNKQTRFWLQRACLWAATNRFNWL